ncbi:tyrosine-protein phosphatase [Enterococcus wangshanyuanii]|uniref:Protein-tyrosine-phosphatase n=1 Tax=Enterococcus wangshanyuanii TaxID=2005703 RepID=A0ABQ1P704_9ENTE|nr:tyrosine-protein phosphatase [Enterococcus wangshanyuanii]GGC90121.1 protein-tyrosine-phosphatase [Enterococcus wangshanyuanii]
MVEQYTVTQTKKNQFTFETLTASTSEIEVYVKKTPTDNQPIFLLKTAQPRFEVEVEADDFRPYFLIKDQQSEKIVAERTLPVAGMNNFRDMGGYEAGKGKTVKWGMLYRSDHIYNAEQKGIEYLKQLQIHTIIDYRSEDEIAKYPNKKIAEGIKTYQLDPDAHAAELSAQFTSSKDNEDINLINKIIEQKENGQLISRYDIVMEQYKNFVHKEKSKQAFRQLLEIAADPKAPAIVQHCRGGKDRTGFGAMLLLGVLGVGKAELIADYMLTHTNRVERNQIKMTGYKKLTSDPDVLNYLYSLIETKAAFIEASITEIEQQYGSITEYALKELGINEQTIIALRELYLE